MVSDGAIPLSPVAATVPAQDQRRSAVVPGMPVGISLGMSGKKEGKLTSLPSHLVPTVRWEPLSASTTSTAPAGRISHAMARRSDRQLGESLYVIGGQTLPNCARREREVAAFRTTDDVSFGTSTGSTRVEWHAVRGELPQRLQSPVACAIGSSIVVFGGYDVDAGTATNAVHLYDSERGEWLSLPYAGGSPPPCFEHAAVACAGDRQMLVHGGRGAETSTALESLFTLELGTQSIHYRPLLPQATSDLGNRDGLRTLFKAPVRRAHTLCKGSESGRAYLFGGFGFDNRVTDELHVLDLQHCIWIAVEADGAKGSFPRARAYHTSTVLGCYMAVFGGEDDDGICMSDLHLLHLPTLLWTCPQVQVGPRDGLVPHAAKADSGEAASAPTAAAQDAQHDIEVKEKKDAGVGGKSSGTKKAEGDASAEADVAEADAAEEESNASGRARDGPGARSRHAAVGLPKGSTDGTHSLIIFGGVGRFSGFLDDVRSLVLELPPDAPGPIGQTRSSVTAASSDAALDFCTSELENNVRRAQAEHSRRMDVGQEELKQLGQEVLNLQTRTMAVEAQEKKNADLTHDAQDLENAGQEELKDRKRQQWDDYYESKSKLRELQIELERLNAKVSRLQGAAMADEAQLLPVSDISFPEDDVLQHVQNEKAPTGTFIRREGYWRSTIVTCEDIKIFKTEEEEIQQNVSTRSVSKKGYQDREKLAQARRVQEHQHWEQATWRELRILSRLRHPNLQEVFGASMTADSVLLVCEPNLIRLSAHVATLQRPLAENEKLYVALDIANALEYLHTKGVAHRQVEEDNVLLTDPESIAVKLAGHFAARVLCHVANKPFKAPEPEVEPDYPPSESGYSNRISDSRAVSESGYKPSRKSTKGTVAPDQRTLSDPRTADVMAFGALLDWLWTGAEMDRSIELVAEKCRSADATMRPSARVVQKALWAVQHGDVDDLPEVTGDTSVESALADLAVVSDEDC